MPMNDKMMENITFAELRTGQSAGLTRTLTQKDIDLFAAVSGDVNPAHLDENYAEQSPFQGVIAHGMWSGGLVSTVLGTMLPGPGTIYLGQDMQFEKPVRLGDTVTVRVTVRDKHKDRPVVTLDCLCLNATGETVLRGTATVLAPTEKLVLKRPEIPSVMVLPRDHYGDILEKCAALGPIKVAVVHPVSANVIRDVLEAVEARLIDPVLIGPAERIREACKTCSAALERFTIIDTEHSHAAAAKAAAMAAGGEVEAIMKGSLHTDELLTAIVSAAAGLRTERRISHAYIMNVMTYHKPLIITDAAINIAPTLEQKADICRNAIDLWRVLFGDNRKPKVALLSAVETVMSAVPSTIEAAALCKMAQRGQISGAEIDGPLAFDNAISKDAAAGKGIVSSVAGDADILVVPNIETGNALAKQMIFLGHADAAGIVLGARVPVILTSRADSTRTRLLSCCVALALSKARKEGRIK